MKGKARGRGRPRAKIELAPLGGKWDGAEFYSPNTHQRFYIGKQSQVREMQIRLECASLVSTRAFACAGINQSSINSLPLQDKRRDPNFREFAHCAGISDIGNDTRQSRLGGFAQNDTAAIDS